VPRVLTIRMIRSAAQRIRRAARGLPRRERVARDILQMPAHHPELITRRWRRRERGTLRRLEASAWPGGEDAAIVAGWRKRNSR
jgi:hypothetical protein